MTASELVDDRLSCIVVAASRGHFRDSLVALLRTLSPVEIDVLDISPFGRYQIPSQRGAPDIVILDAEESGSVIGETMTTLRKDWPESRYIALVDHVWQARHGQSLSVDCILAKSTPAGEFLPAIREQLRYIHQSKAGESRPASPTSERLEAVIPTIS